jgi:hypothetical protein
MVIVLIVESVLNGAFQPEGHWDPLNGAFQPEGHWDPLDGAPSSFFQRQQRGQYLNLPSFRKDRNDRKNILRTERPSQHSLEVPHFVIGHSYHRHLVRPLQLPTYQASPVVHFLDDVVIAPLDANCR